VFRRIHGLGALAAWTSNAGTDEEPRHALAAFRWTRDGRPRRLLEFRKRVEMSNQSNRSMLILLTSHWISMLGVTLVTLAGCSWLLLLPAHMRGHVDNPYIGLLVFIAIPVFFFLGLALIPIGI